MAGPSSKQKKFEQNFAIKDILSLVGKRDSDIQDKQE